MNYNDISNIFNNKDENGNGIMSPYKVFEGVSIIYIDLDMKECKSNFKADADMLCIDHCREGRMEQEINNGKAYTYLGAGDLKIDTRTYHDGNFQFPLSHYHGITISFELKKAVESISRAMQGYNVNLYDIQKKYCSKKYPYVIKNNKGIEHIFSELYTVPQKIIDPYLKIKILELLLFLDALELDDKYEKRPYFYKGQVEKVKKIQNFMVENLDKHYTLQYLSKEFDISLTSMKRCFKNVYGNSIFAYMRIYRMNRAAALLKYSKEMSIGEISAMVGYDSQGKFSTAFKEIMGISPLKYRNNI